ncbi:hypothetical protein [Bradyrhizobium sp. CCBAU 53415]|uniref:hypothetical protein n=1 Tax=Bradyrhizobium sp. CCBAU 53415 TaxID=1325119 RepID=UPI0023058865|nr:hypothetical protein [Bradyrhizobium sp. CCBAU 53415]MDA9464511.1 hypothetical protein [Bradyrhizobium sp. CCBAU 53415]
MIYLISAIGLIFMSNLIAMFVISSVDIVSYVDVMVICRQLAEAPDQCSSAAQSVGWIGCISSVILILLLLAANRRFPGAPKFRRVGGAAFAVFIPLIVATAWFHLLIELRSPWPMYREEIFKEYASALSLGNLLWPLCLQLAINAEERKWRVLFLAALAPIVAASPFRGVLFAVAVFGISLPSLDYAIRQVQIFGVWSKQAAIYGVTISTVVLAMVFQLGLETKERPTDLKTQGGLSAQIAGKLGQRIAIPLFQAEYAGAHSLDPHMPSLVEETLSKLRLRSGTSSNGYLYAKSHGGATYGETTSLFSGEALLRTTSHPLIWSVVAPFLLILVWIGLRAIGYDAGVLIGVAIWRGSLGGVIGILPSLAIQLGLFVVLCRIFGKLTTTVDANG